MRTRHTTRLISVALIGFAINTALADTVVTLDGSRIVGTIEQLVNGKLAIVTDFAGRLEIDAAKIQTVTTDRKVNVEFSSGDRLVGTVEVPPGGEGSVVQTAMGAIPIGAAAMTAIWPEGAESPQVVVMRAQLEAEKQALKPKWTATLEAGATLTDGNTDTLAARGRFDLKRKTQDDLLRFYVAADYAEQNDVRNRNEYKGGIHYENMLTERWNWYTRMELEYDEFENLDLRATTAAGVGYYWLKQPQHELQTRIGGGYRHEAYKDGNTVDNAVVDLGLDYRLDITPWARFTHSTVYTPDIEEFNNYRLALDTALAVPLGDSNIWKLKLGVMNQYNSDPPRGLERLDNTYYANIMLELK